jgi:hypothetical protein
LAQTAFTLLRPLWDEKNADHREHGPNPPILPPQAFSDHFDAASEKRSNRIAPHERKRPRSTSDICRIRAAIKRSSWCALGSVLPACFHQHVDRSQDNILIGTS